ncbi:MAG: hypothetical protein ACYSOG_00730 [Planctomycetota bacterium]|jgi:Rod binding domain-containing protein
MNIDPLLTRPALMNGLESMDGSQSAAKDNGVGAIKNASFDPDDSSNEQVHSLYCTFLADSVSQSGGFGLWETIYEQMADTAGLNSGSQAVANQLDQSV